MNFDSPPDPSSAIKPPPARSTGDPPVWPSPASPADGVSRRSLETASCNPTTATAPAFLPITSLALLAALTTTPAAAPAANPSTLPTIPSTSPTPSAPATDPATAARLARLGKRDLRVHDPSTILREGAHYYLFSTGPGVRSHRSEDLLHWEPGPPVFSQRPAWTLDAVPGHRGGPQGHYWAPDLLRIRDRYLLFYSVSTFGKNTSAIGVASTPTLDPADPAHAWTDGGIVVQSRQGADNFNAIDPAPALDADGRLWLAFGSFWSGIKLIELDPATGRRVAPDSPMYSLASAREIEAPYIHFRDGHYYLFVNFGLCCRGADSTYNIRVGRSNKITGPYTDKDGKDLLHGGGTPLLSTDGPFVGPGHAAILTRGSKDYLSLHFYDPTTPKAPGTLALRPLHWTPDAWPEAD